MDIDDDDLKARLHLVGGYLALSDDPREESMSRTVKDAIDRIEELESELGKSK